MATRWLDFRAVKARVSIRDALAHYGMFDRLRERKPGQFVGPCPIHGGSNGTSFHVDTTKNVFHCFSQCGGGNVLDLVMKIDSCTIREAAERLADLFDLQLDKDRPPDRNSAKVSQESAAQAAAHPSRQVVGHTVNPPLERPLRNLLPTHEYIASRGISLETAAYFGIGYCIRGLMKDRVAIPIHNDRDELVAYAGRAVDPELARERGKYRLPTGFSKGHVIWNLNRARNHAERGLVVCEGFFSAMHVHQAGFANVVALMGAQLSERQEELLLQAADRLALMFDGDEAGEACSRQFYERLRCKLYLKSVQLNAGQQPDSLPADRIRDLLS